MHINLIAAIDRNNAIGINNQLPWHLPDDLKFFKSQTQGGTIVMGRRTFESLGSRPLPNRRNIILTKQPLWTHALVEVAHDWCQLKTDLINQNLDTVWIIGGGEIYKTCIPDATQLVLTQVNTYLPNADAWFPDWDKAHWQCTSQVPHPVDDKHAFSFEWQIWRST